MRTFTSSMLNSWSATHKQSLLWCSSPHVMGEGVFFSSILLGLDGVSHYICPWPPYEWFWQEFCWMRGRKHGQFFYCLILFSAKKESPISFLADGNMTMCKILKDLSKASSKRRRVLQSFYYQNYFWQLKLLWPFTLSGMEKKLSIFRPFSSLKKD